MYPMILVVLVIVLLDYWLCCSNIKYADDRRLYSSSIDATEAETQDYFSSSLFPLDSSGASSITLYSYPLI